MPIRQIEITTCNLCGAEKQRELFPKKDSNGEGWLAFTVKNADDKREKVYTIICPECVKTIIGRLPKEDPTMPAPEVV